MENMSSEPSQGGGLGGTGLGPAGIWSLDEGTRQGQAESFIGMSPRPFCLQSQEGLCSHCRDLNTGPSIGLEQEGTRKLCELHFR